VLGDERHARAGERLAERAVVARRGQAPLELGERDGLAAAGDVLAGGVDDAIEDAQGASSRLMPM
jgi:hypothetical protein